MHWWMIRIDTDFCFKNTDSPHEIVACLQMTIQEQHVPASQMHYKEEAKARVKTDTNDRKSLRDKLEVCIDPLHPEENQQGLLNIVTGHVLTHLSINVDNATEFGTKQMEEFERTWPASFHETLHKCVTTMGAIPQRQGKETTWRYLALRWYMPELWPCNVVNDTMTQGTWWHMNEPPDLHQCLMIVEPWK